MLCFKKTSKPISRVLSGMIIYLDSTLLHCSSHQGSGRANHCSAAVLLRMGFTQTACVTTDPVSSYLTFSPLHSLGHAVIFCCTFLKVTFTGDYPASCPVKPGLSSNTAFRLCACDHSAYLQRVLYHKNHC